VNWNICEDLYPGPTVEVDDILTLYINHSQPKSLLSRDRLGGGRQLTFFCANPPSHRFAGELARVIAIDPFQVLFVGYVVDVTYDFNVPFITGRQDPLVQVTMVEDDQAMMKLPRWIVGL
jgi:hypothetical protein